MRFSLLPLLTLLLFPAQLAAFSVRGGHLSDKGLSSIDQPFTPTERGCTTNAECLQRGLPILKPSPRRTARRSGMSSQVINTPVLVYPAGQGGPNPTRRKRYLGEAGEKRDTLPAGAFGWLEDTVQNDGQYDFSTPDVSGAVTFSIDITTSQPQSILRSDFTRTPYLCAGLTGTGLGSTYDVASITQCASPGTVGEAPSTNVNCNGDSTAEAFVWVLNTSTGQLSIQWYNSGASDPIDAYPIGIEESGGIIYIAGLIAGSLSDYNADTGGSFDAYEFYIQLS
ncbi:hypothetical protein BD324DRAFT_623508 [Kockovaella imperatae]|uniref:Ig-like domain-containing protein n=1 Tax=Kockovaella imperatae TaxID=4999 RepID=A0A1Y1UII5_9TREE|nr:hypothetical protein BD324DRAFT_623508 [Kockovaella imperatae]ORX37841.1 hypothetical protein BD324DRAFT_623508 [Kockovaella imperatae]